MPQSSASRSWVEHLPARTFFSIDDVPGSARAVESLLSRLARGGEMVHRVKPGLYWKTPPPTRFGAAKPAPMESALAAAGPGAGPTGWSATHYLGLTTQVPAVASVAMVGRGPKGLTGVHFTSRSNLKRCDLPPIEIAVLEALRSYPAFTELGWTDVVARLRQLVRDGRVDLVRVAAVAARENRPGLRERLTDLAGP